MAGIASRHDAVVIRGVVGAHFADEVLSWHHVNGQPADEILPAILITTRNPHSFRENSSGAVNQDRMLLIPLRQCCNSTTDVVDLIDNLFRDVQEKKELSGFQIAKKLSAGKQGALVDALILKPTIYGMGVDFNRLLGYLKAKVKAMHSKLRR